MLVLDPDVNSMFPFLFFVTTASRSTDTVFQTQSWVILANSGSTFKALYGLVERVRLFKCPLSAMQFAANAIDEAR